jgi:hypothetical protein
MPLKTILINCATEIGLQLTNVADKAFLIAKINEAAEDLYTSDDLVDCLREQVFSFEVDDQQITVPWYVYKIRGARWSRLKLPIRLDDYRPRYATQGYSEMLWRGMTWRIKNKQAIGKDISNAAPLTLSIALPETVAFTVNITGSTANSIRITEQVTFAPGDITKTCVNTFISNNGYFPIESITKDILTNNDVIITDTNGEEISRIPNSELSASYTVIQITDFDQSTFINDGCSCIELLYKTKFTPFRNDFDEFPCGPIYDQCIFYKTLEIFHGKNGEVEKAALAKLKCDQLIGNLAQETELGENIRLDFGYNRFLRAQNRGVTNIKYYDRYWSR